jgi:hypothetical protein
MKVNKCSVLVTGEQMFCEQPGGVESFFPRVCFYVNQALARPPPRLCAGICTYLSSSSSMYLLLCMYVYYYYYVCMCMYYTLLLCMYTCVCTIHYYYYVCMYVCMYVYYTTVVCVCVWCTVRVPHSLCAWPSLCMRVCTIISY